MRKLETLFALCTLTLMAAPALAKGSGVIKFDEATFEVAESAGRATITVERSGGEDGAVTVRYATSDGTATARTTPPPAAPSPGRRATSPARPSPSRSPTTRRPSRSRRST